MSQLRGHLLRSLLSVVRIVLLVRRAVLHRSCETRPDGLHGTELRACVYADMLARRLHRSGSRKSHTTDPPFSSCVQVGMQFLNENEVRRQRCDLPSRRWAMVKSRAPPSTSLDSSMTSIRSWLRPGLLNLSPRNPVCSKVTLRPLRCTASLNSHCACWCRIEIVDQPCGQSEIHPAARYSGRAHAVAHP